jgi:hypothetical protein
MKANTTIEAINELDTVLVPKGSEYKMYHGLEVESEGELITPRDAKRHGVFHPIEKAHVHATLDGLTIPLPKQRALIARTPDDRRVPLHMATDKYSVIENQKVAQSVSEALKQTDCGSTLSSMGTLNNLKMFFMCYKMGKYEVNGDRHNTYLNVTSGHNGEALRVFLSGLRLVCLNSIRQALREEQGFIDLKVTHRGDVNVKCADLSQSIAGLIEGQRKHIEAMEILAAQKVAESDIDAIVAGYFLQDGFSKTEKFSGRTLNTVSGITDLAFGGKGNRGETMYDVLNGGTEYWTSGEGVGVRTSNASKAYSSEYGTAAKHKTRFADYLLSADESSIENGRRVLTATLSA